MYGLRVQVQMTDTGGPSDQTATRVVLENGGIATVITNPDGSQQLIVQAEDEEQIASLIEAQRRVHAQSEDAHQHQGPDADGAGGDQQQQGMYYIHEDEAGNRYFTLASGEELTDVDAGGGGGGVKSEPRSGSSLRLLEEFESQSAEKPGEKRKVRD
jgi:hypothetical protein